MHSLPETITRKQFQEWMDGLASEIVAGGVLIASTEGEKAWNSATFRAQRIAKRYRDGEGLYQITTGKEAA